MRHAIAILSVACLSATAAVAQQSETYTVNGTNLDGSPYRGLATITLLSDTTCGIEWVMGDAVTTGICMADDTTVAAAYVMNGMPGLVIYRYTGDGGLSGVWTVAGLNGAGTEILTPMQ